MNSVYRVSIIYNMGDLCNPRSLRALGQEGFVWRAFNIWVILIVAWCFLVSYRKPICWLHPWLLYSYMVIYYIYTLGGPSSPILHFLVFFVMFNETQYCVFAGVTYSFLNTWLSSWKLMFVGQFLFVR